MWGGLLVLGFNYFFPSGKGNPDLKARIDLSGQMFKAPVSRLEVMPLAKEIDFVDDHKAGFGQDVIVQTPLCDYAFSTDGAILSGITYKKHIGREGVPLTTLYKGGDEEREQGCFTLALDHTPQLFSLRGNKKTDRGHEIAFQAEVDDWKITKTYTVLNDSYALNLDCSFKKIGNKANTLRPRLFFSGPIVSEVDEDAVEGLVNNLDQVTTTKVKALNEGDYAWKYPVILGASDRYFLHSFYKASDEEIIERAYFKRMDTQGLFSILECKDITEDTTFSLGFYMGPKLLENLVNVDSRLAGVLDFGWFSFLCNMLLRLVEWLYSFLGNYGLAIILATILVKIPFLPVTIWGKRKAAKSTAFEQRNAAAIQAINIRYKNDIVKRSEELSNLYGQHGVSQAGKLAGALPIVMQLPLLICFYRILSNYIGLYHAPFGLWLIDLSAKDPYYVLPLVFAAGMFLQPKPATNDRSAQIMAFVLPVFAAAIFSSLPAGVVLYMATNSFATIGEEYISRAFFGLNKAV